MPDLQGDGDLIALRCSPSHAAGVLRLVRDNLAAWMVTIESDVGRLTPENLDGFAAELRVDAGMLLALVDAETVPR